MENLDCLVITETWFDEVSVYTDVILDGYYIQLASHVGKRDSGIAVVYNSQL